MDTREFPYVPEELLTFLEARFPDRLPDGPEATHNVTLFRTGQVSVVRFLKEIYRQQNLNILRA